MEDIGASNGYIFDRVLNTGFTELPEVDDSTDDSRIEQLFYEYLNGIKKSIELVVTDKRAKKESGKFIVCGFDLMNMVRYDNMVLHRRFIFVFDGPERRLIKGPMVTFSESGDYRKCEALVMLM